MFILYLYRNISLNFYIFFDTPLPSLFSSTASVKGKLVQFLIVYNKPEVAAKYKWTYLPLPGKNNYPILNECCIFGANNYYNIIEVQQITAFSRSAPSAS